MHTVYDFLFDLSLVPIFKLLLPILTLRLFFGKPKVKVQVMRLVLVKGADEVYILGVEIHVAEELAESTLNEADALFRRINFVSQLFAEGNKAMPQILFRLCPLPNGFELFLRDHPVAVEDARAFLEVFEHGTRLGFGILAVEFSVGRHVLIEIAAAVRELIVRTLACEPRLFLRRGIALHFPRRVSNVKNDRLFAYRFSSFMLPANITVAIVRRLCVFAWSFTA